MNEYSIVLKLNGLKWYKFFQVSRMQNGGTLKAGRDNDRVSFDSPKISFRWEAESCSSITSAYSSVSAASSFKNCSITLNSTAINHYYPRKGSWITTDSECKILIPISPNLWKNIIHLPSTKRSEIRISLPVLYEELTDFPSLPLMNSCCARAVKENEDRWFSKGFINCLICLQYVNCRFYAKLEDLYVKFLQVYMKNLYLK